MRRDFNQTQVAVYKGDELLASGSIRQCARQLGIEARTIYYYLMPAYKRKLKARKLPTSSKNVRTVVEI